MEDTLRDVPESVHPTKWYSLNLCFNGRYSQSRMRRIDATGATGLNPCFNGRYSQSSFLSSMKDDTCFCLNPCSNGRYSQRQEVFELISILSES